MVRHVRLCLASLFLASVAHADGSTRIHGEPTPGHAADCLCRAPGITVRVGQSLCLPTSQGRRLLTCIMVLNNTSWRFEDRPCPES